MPTTLWRHLIVELTKMLVVTTGVMVLVLAFGAAAKPLMDNQIGASLIAKYVTFAMVPMMQFALPFAAGFAATLVLHRFVSDNEVTAMSSAGMSYVRILMPTVLLGAALAGVMFGMVAFIVPVFWSHMKSMTGADATEFLVAAVNRGEALKSDNMLIYADSVELVPNPADTGAVRRLILHGVAAIELNKTPFAAPLTEFTAETAAVDVHTTESGPIAKLVLLNATVFRPGEGAIASVPRVEPEAISLGRSIDIGPKETPLLELMELRKNPDPLMDVQKVARPLAAVAAEYEMWQCIVADAADDRTIVLRQAGSGREYRLENARLRAGDVEPATRGAPVQVTEWVNGRAVRTTDADRATLRVLSEVGFAPSVVLSVSASRGTRNVIDGVTARWPPRIDDLQPVGCTLRDWARVPGLELIEVARGMPTANTDAPYRNLSGRAQELAAVLERVRVVASDESMSHIVQRYAQSVSVMLILMMGAVLAVWLRRALPLTVYVLAFLPAVGDILMIAGGQQVMKNGHFVPGMLLMWGGNGLLLAVLLWAWVRLSRN